MDFTESDAIAYLRTHPSFLERYVVQHVEPEALEAWAQQQRALRRLKDGGARKTSISKWRLAATGKRRMLQELTESLQRNCRREQVLWELADCITSATDADGFRLFLIDNADEPLRLRPYYNDDVRDVRAYSGSAIANHVAKHKEPVRTSKLQHDERFPNHRLQEGEPDAYVLSMPVMQANSQISAVLEMYRSADRSEFQAEDEEVARSYLIWGGIALHYAQLSQNMTQERSLNTFLLEVVQSIFKDMVSMDALVAKIMDFAQKLVDADRASLFLKDETTNTLYSRIFDVGGTPRQRDEEIRFPVGKGIAGIVAENGEVMNIKDAYADPRFNREVDQQTGYKTNTILCMPVYHSKSSIIGVVQMVNKRSGVFTPKDEKAFNAFAMYCGLALHHAELYDRISKSEQQYKVAVEVLSYHRSCTDEEYQLALRDGIPQRLPAVDDYHFNPFALDEMQQVRHAIFMFADLFGMERFEQESLVKFTLTVKKNYRRVPYHNWMHGFSVANAMYVILKRARVGVFSELERLALFISALCHDLDHRGKNNKWMLDTQSPLAIMYSTSTMENHHFNQTVTILHQDGYNIFHKLSNAEYKQIMALIKHCILATDLAVFAKKRADLEGVLSAGEFSFENAAHKQLLAAITMTASDLSASAKPWEVQAKTVEIIFKEFYDQGDAERAAGRTPLPMMDRRRSDDLPESQVGFLTNICAPCYTLLYQLVPETKPLLDMVNANLEQWKTLHKKKKEN